MVRLLSEDVDLVRHTPSVRQMYTPSQASPYQMGAQVRPGDDPRSSNAAGHGPKLVRCAFALRRRWRRFESCRGHQSAKMFPQLRALIQFGEARS